MQQTLEHTTGAIGANEFELAFQLAGVGLCITENRNISRCNAEFARMFEYQAEELIGRSLECLYPSAAEFENTGRRGFAAMQKTGGFNDERIMARKDGGLFWCHVIGRPLYRDRPFAYAVWSFDDISEKRPVKVGLTGREREIAQQIIQGKTAKEMARVFDISSRTVEAHRARLMRKFSAKTIAELITKMVGLT